MVYTRNFFPNTLIHPGITLSETLDAVVMSQVELAVRTGLSEKHISGIMNGRDGITPETALKLERALWISAAFWNNLETAYHEDRARIEEAARIENEKEQARAYPYSELQELGFVPVAKKIEEKYAALLDFFGVSSLSVLQEIGSFQAAIGSYAFRKSQKTRLQPEALMAWLRCGEIMAKGNEVWDFNKTKLNAVLPEIKKLTLCPKVDLGKIKSLLADMGVGFAFVKGFPYCPVYGVTRKIAGRPFIQMSDRLHKADIFWFSLFHELAHVSLHLHKKDDVFIHFDNVSETEEEEANEWASDRLVDRKSFDDFINKGSINPEKIAEFSKAQGVWTSIVAWKIGHIFENTEAWKFLSGLRIKLEFSE